MFPNKGIPQNQPVITNDGDNNIILPDTSLFNSDPNNIRLPIHKNEHDTIFLNLVMYLNGTNITPFKINDNLFATPSIRNKINKMPFEQSDLPLESSGDLPLGLSSDLPLGLSGDLPLGLSGNLPLRLSGNLPVKLYDLNGNFNNNNFNNNNIFETKEDYFVNFVNSLPNYLENMKLAKIGSTEISTKYNINEHRYFSKLVNLMAEYDYILDCKIKVNAKTVVTISKINNSLIVNSFSRNNNTNNICSELPKYDYNITPSSPNNIIYGNNIMYPNHNNFNSYNPEFI